MKWINKVSSSIVTHTGIISPGRQCIASMLRKTSKPKNLTNSLGVPDSMWPL